MTKPCKSCKEPIDGEATKCPKCQAYQSWYRNPQWMIPLALLPMLVFMFWSSGRLLNRIPFSDCKDLFSTSIVGEVESAAAPQEERLITVRVENKSAKTWRRPTFRIEHLNADGAIVTVEHLSDYNVVMEPGSSTLVTLRARMLPAGSVASRRVALTDVDSDRF